MILYRIAFMCSVVECGDRLNTFRCGDMLNTWRCVERRKTIGDMGMCGTMEDYDGRLRWKTIEDMGMCRTMEDY